MNNFLINRVELPFDFTAASLNALETAIEVCSQQSADLTIVYIKDTLDPLFFHRPKSSYVPIANMVQNIESKLEALVSELQNRSTIQISYEVIAGAPAFSICKFAWERNIDLIILGHDQTSPMTKLVDHSVVDKVVQTAPCPVLCIPSNRHVGKFNKVVFPVRNAPKMLAKWDVLKTLLSDNNPSLVVAGLTMINDDQNFDVVTDLVKQVNARLQAERVEFSSFVTSCDNLTGQLLGIVRDINPDLIVITALVNYNFRQLLLEYYSKSIVNTASCAVLSIRPDMPLVNG